MDVRGICWKKVHKSYCSRLDFMQVMEEMLDRCTIEEYEIFAVIAKKNLLKKYSRNGEKFIHPNQVLYIRGATESLEEYKRVNAKE